MQLSEGQFGDAMEHSAIGTALVSLDGGWLQTNTALRRLIGYEAEELARLSFQDLTHPEDLAGDLAQVSHLLSGAGSSYQMEKRYIRKDGSQVWVLLSVSLVRSPDGQPQFFISQVQDISERKLADLERDRLTERLTLATRASRLGVWEWAPGAGSLIWDERMFELYGRDPQRHAPDLRLFLNAVHPEDRERVREELELACVGTRPFDTEFRVVHLDGQVRDIRALATVTRDGDGRPLRMIGTNWDVTETRRLNAEAEAASEAKSQFLASMSHEIRTPLNGVLGMAQAMAADSLSVAQRSRLDVIRESGESLLTILNDILDLSKVEAGQMAIEAVDFDLGGLLASTHATFASIAADKGLNFRLEIDGARGVYRGDPSRLRQVVANLISNALKFTGEGEVRITARIGEAGLAIAVNDSGVGIPAAALGSIFNRFTQADASTTRTYGGTGLGLAISRELARLMGGDIDVESRPGEGATFTLRLPIWPTGEALPAAAPPPLLDQARPELKVLVAEDNRINQLVIQALLEQVGVVPTLVANGEDAVAAWQAAPWDVIMMDVQMPVMDGVEATRSIRRQEALTRRPRTPVIALTANAMPKHLEDYSRAGMDAFVSKPIDVRALLLGLERVLDPDPEPAENVA